jgi:adenylate kinase
MMDLPVPKVRGFGEEDQRIDSMELILFGAPGSGKGTQAKKIAAWLSIPQISTGDILRAEIQKESELGSKVKSILAGGGLVGDDIVIDLIKGRLKEKDCGPGFILDGFPRTAAQGAALDQVLSKMGRKIKRVLSLDLAEDVLVNRITKRQTCAKCGAIYNTAYSPAPGGLCACGSDDLRTRADDNEETVRNRLKNYNETSSVLIDIYEKQNLLSTIESTGLTPDEVFAKIREELARFID